MAGAAAGSAADGHPNPSAVSLLPGLPASLTRKKDMNGLHQEDAASKDLLVTPLMGSSPGSFSSH